MEGAKSRLLTAFFAPYDLKRFTGKVLVNKELFPDKTHGTAIYADQARGGFGGQCGHIWQSHGVSEIVFLPGVTHKGVVFSPQVSGQSALLTSIKHPFVTAGMFFYFMIIVDPRALITSSVPVFDCTHFNSSPPPETNAYAHPNGLPSRTREKAGRMEHVSHSQTQALHVCMEKAWIDDFSTPVLHEHLQHADFSRNFDYIVLHGCMPVMPGIFLGLWKRADASVSLAANGGNWTGELVEVV